MRIMVVPILIDTSDLMDKYNAISTQQVDDICDNIAKTLAARYAQVLIDEAGNALHQTKNRYINAISLSDTARFQGTVILDYSQDPVVKMIEEGCPPFDMKIKMLLSNKAKIGKNGSKYLTIPFRIGTPGIVAQSDVFSRIMSKDIYSVVKGKETNIVVPGRGNRSSGLTVKELPVQYQSPQKRAEIKDSAGKVLFKEYEHKTPLDQGLFKLKDAVTGQNTYGSFRRVSDKSDSMAFIHPGIQKYNLVQRALSNFNQQKETENALSVELRRLGLYE